ncbi:hypothetical protein JCM33374_g2225 [Metschnikowia sp. JCM 33374]|nr:hypothetical protein JCM33374_g2225 [Metschnikowia sp. JCM 33374]
MPATSRSLGPVGPITVGARDMDDHRADFSYYGRSVGILSGDIISDTTGLAGISMANSITPPDLKRKVVAYGTGNGIGGLDHASRHMLAIMVVVISGLNNCPLDLVDLSLEKLFTSECLA